MGLIIMASGEEHWARSYWDGKRVLKERRGERVVRKKKEKCRRIY